MKPANDKSEVNVYSSWKSIWAILVRTSENHRMKIKRNFFPDLEEYLCKVLPSSDKRCVTLIDDKRWISVLQIRLVFSLKFPIKTFQMYAIFKAVSDHNTTHVFKQFHLSVSD